MTAALLGLGAFIALVAGLYWLALRDYLNHRPPPDFMRNYGHCHERVER